MNYKPTHLVFVYGTLKKDEPNCNFLNSMRGFAQFVSKAMTVDRYPLIIYSRYNIPFLLDIKGQGKRVHGEVYAVDDNVLADLDDLEDHPNFYLRKPIDIELNKDDGEPQIIKIWTYLFPLFKPEMLESQFIDNYSSNGDHGLKYVTGEEARTLEDLF